MAECTRTVHWENPRIIRACSLWTLGKYAYYSRILSVYSLGVLYTITRSFGEELHKIRRKKTFGIGEEVLRWKKNQWSKISWHCLWPVSKSALLIHSSPHLHITVHTLYMYSKWSTFVFTRKIALCDWLKPYLACVLFIPTWHAENISIFQISPIFIHIVPYAAPSLAIGGMEDG